MDIELQTLNRGNRPDYVLGTSLGWDAFDVVRFRADEGIDELFTYDIVLARDRGAPSIDIEALVDEPATLRIATEARWRPVHGVIAEAELLDETNTLILYRVVLVPHLWRASLRTRCRTFVDTSIQDIVTAVLANNASGGATGRGLSEMSHPPKAPAAEPSFGAFDAPAAHFRWALTDPERVQSKRPFVVQYNESDLAFVERLLESEGISFFFEHGSDAAVLTLSDRPGHAPLHARDARHTLVAGSGGATRNQEVVRSHRTARRMRASAVVMRDYRWRASRTRFEARTRASGAPELEHFEFPARDEDHAEPGKGPAQFQMERFVAEQRLAQGYSTVRTHEPGYRFTLTDRAGTRDDVELLVTRVETHAVQLFPDDTQLDLEPVGLSRHAKTDEPFYEVRYQTLPANITYRPERKTKKNLIFGVQTATVTAEEIGEGTELNSDRFGRVRVRFPWDQRENDGTPTSKWVRVAQYWAGPGFGALYVPRVGHEVLVAFERGDPDRPIIVGRVYNEQNPPPYTEPNTTISTLKSDSVGKNGESAEGFNEFRFEDKAGDEQVFLHAQKNLDEVVRNSHSTTVGGSQSNSVGGDQSNTVFGSRTHHVHGTESVTVGGNRNTHFESSEFHQVADNRITGISGNDIHGVVGHHSITVGGSQEISVKPDRKLSVAATHDISVGGMETLTVGGPRAVTVAGPHAHSSPHHHFESTTFSSNAAVHNFNCSVFKINAGGATLTMQGGLISLNNGAGASITLAGGAILINSGSHLCTTGSVRSLSSGGPTLINAGGPIIGGAPLIKLN